MQELFHLDQEFVGWTYLGCLQKLKVIYPGLRVFWKENHSVYKITMDAGASIFLQWQNFPSTHKKLTF